MKLPRSVVRCLLGALILGNIALRYPRTPHEVGVDSFFIHNLATNISGDGFAEWILNPLSFFGWYPLSYPSGGPFILATFSNLGGLPVEASILLLSLAFGAVGVLTSFIMAREFRDDDVFCLAVAFIYSSAPRYLAFTLWSASMRSLFMVLLPIFIWIVLRTYREPKPVNLVLALGFFLLLAATHRLAALLAVVMVAFVAAVLFLVLLRILRVRFPKIVLASPFRRASPYLALGAFASIAGIMVFGTDILSEYSMGELFSGSSIQIQLLNFGVSLARSVGLSLLFACLGIVILVRSKNKTLREPFLLISFLGLTPTLFLRQYTGFYILPFIALFGALAFVGVARLRRVRLRRWILIGCVVAMFLFSSSVLEYEIEHTTWLPMAQYGTGLYTPYAANPCNVISNDGLVGIRIASISGCSYLPVGGAGTTFQSPELLAYGFFTPQEVEANTVRVPLQQLTLESDSPWIASMIQAEADWVYMMQSSFDARDATLARYNPTLYLENEHMPLRFFAYGNQYPSAFAVAAHERSYKLYDVDAESIWYVGLPRST